MVEPTDMPNMRERFERVRNSISGGGGGPTGGDVEHRVRALEKNFEKMDDKLDELLKRATATEVMLASINGKIDTKASATDLTKIAGRVEALPTTWQMITLVFGILGGAFLILRFGLPHAS